ncbi:hypothetical protein F511_35719 [Dorcoceras hygrometricum]|uniref:Uncharacterized protein n=1 Tax=Dorcoceras hygrometricum TaxID=472368 RepID=A0A2Z7CVT7_9LAMI|nr:hypothetical protein F511_35719 [Dorcoceras hygrometricum]
MKRRRYQMSINNEETMQAEADQRSKHIQNTTKACKEEDTRTTLSVLYRTPSNGKKLVSNGLI